MQDGLNRRIFNTTEAHHGPDIRLGDDGIVHLSPGTYRITGFSMVTMQDTMEPPKVTSNYPGYCLVYDLEDEAIPGTSTSAWGHLRRQRNVTPANLSLCCEQTRPRSICLGHQSGNTLLEPIYLPIYEIGTEKSPYHIFAKMAIYKM